MENILQEETKKQRFFEIDFLRGLCVLLMIFDHLMFAFLEFLPFINQMFSTNLWENVSLFADRYWHNYYRTLIRYIVISVFMILCGISCTLTRSNLIRGIKALLVALAMTIITGIASTFLDFDITIRFGVIHMLAFSMLIYWVLSLPHKFTKIKILKYLPFFVGVFLLAFFFLKPLGKFILVDDIYGQYIDLAPAFSANRGQKFLSYILDLENYVLYSSDYFPLLPYSLLVLMGSAIGHLLYENKTKNCLSKLDGLWNKPICFVGKRAFIVYLFHQALIVVILFISCFIFSKIG